MTSSAEVVSWNEAMEQCGDDEEFLLELLSDLKEEVDGQMVKMNEILEVSLVCCTNELHE